MRIVHFGRWIRTLACGALAACATTSMAFAQTRDISYGSYYSDGEGTAQTEEYVEESAQPNLTTFRKPNCCMPQEGMTGEEATDDVSRAMLQPEQYAGLGGDTLTVNDGIGGYIDNPIVGNQFRFRADAAYDNFRPDRAEFFYAKCGCFQNGAVGPPNAERSVSYQDLTPYLEFRPFDRTSFFVESPIRFVDPVVNNNHRGFADMNFGFKYAIVANSDAYLTFQFKAYMPTGNPRLGLGTNNVNLEPGLLYWRRMSDRMYFQGELRHWVPVGGTDFAGNVIRYGGGIGYDIYRSCDRCCSNPCCGFTGLRITPIMEVVGWTVMNGKALAVDNNGRGAIEDAGGDTIVNMKLGTRVTWGQRSIYSGWGHALTGDTWYRDILRLEYRRMF